MGTACIVFGVPFLMAFLVGIPWKQVKVLFFVGIGGLIGLIVWQPYRLLRVKTTYDPWSDAQGVGYQAVQSMSTIGSGGLWGMGLGEGVSKYEYLPEAHTDFAFAIFAQEHGYLGVLLVIALFFMLAVCCYYISARARDIYGQILTLASCCSSSGRRPATSSWSAAPSPSSASRCRSSVTAAPRCSSRWPRWASS